MPIFEQTWLKRLYKILLNPIGNLGAYALRISCPERPGKWDRQTKKSPLFKLASAFFDKL